jgi:hypothetical protein
MTYPAGPFSVRVSSSGTVVCGQIPCYVLQAPGPPSRHGCSALHLPWGLV